jgi:hypothetical protein
MNSPNQTHKRLAGIGTDISASSLAGSAIRNARPWSNKALELALGHGFDSHVLGGYRFLMRHYRSNSNVHIFGFSRGAYTARILNDMLDWVGLLSADNEEMIPFIWKAYFEWKVYRQESSYELLNAYRESVCRGDVSVHFLGLFDTVNSVVDLETVVEEDDPSSRIIRHAVSTDERRVKFQPLLLCRKMATGSGGKKPSKDYTSFSAVKYHSNPERLVEGQDIREVWFPGGHSDVGGGWKLDKSERFSLSHNPLVWMVDEARRAGVQFNQEKLQQFFCVEPNASISVESAGVRESLKAEKDKTLSDTSQDGETHPQSLSGAAFNRSLEDSAKGLVHDYLKRTLQVPYSTVIPWGIMEFVPFKRLTLRNDGTWKVTRWPLSMGRMRGIPIDAEIHVSMIRRMQADDTYRPANAILGGGGRGLTIAPPEFGIGEWKVCKYPDDPLRETYILNSQLR